MPQIACPTCETKLDVESSMDGKKMRCGSCQCLFDVTLPRKTKKSKSKRRDHDEDDDDDDLEESTRQDYLDGPKKPKGMAVTSMILGIIAFVVSLMSVFSGVIGTACCCPFISWPFIALGSLLSITGLIFGFLGMKGDGKAFWLTGIITSGLALLVSILVVVLNIIGIGMFAWNVNKPAPTFALPTYSVPTFAAPTTQTPKKIVTSPGNFKVVLMSFELNKRSAILRVLLDSVGIRLSEANTIMNRTPATVLANIDKASADAIRRLLEDAGARATVE